MDAYNELKFQEENPAERKWYPTPLLGTESSSAAMGGVTVAMAWKESVTIL